MKTQIAYKMIQIDFNSAFNRVIHIRLLVVLLMMHLFKAASSKGIDIEATLRRHKIYPDVIDTIPKYIVNVEYRKGVFLEMGNKIDPAEMQWLPKLDWPAKRGQLYTVMMIDPDVPVRKNPSMAQRQHWLVGNIPMKVIRKGDVITGYIGPMSPRNSGLHRTTFLVYLQKKKINFTETRLSSKDRETRGKGRINANMFKDKYNLTLIGMNFARTGWPLLKIEKDDDDDDDDDDDE